MVLRAEFLMTTKAPSAVKPAPSGSLEKLAYDSVAGILVEHPHDLDRLGFNLYQWLIHRRDPLEIVVRSAGVHLRISEEEAVQRIREQLSAHGVKL
jgi:hypothetical protein